MHTLPMPLPIREKPEWLRCEACERDTQGVAIVEGHPTANGELRVSIYRTGESAPASLFADDVLCMVCEAWVREIAQQHYLKAVAKEAFRQQAVEKSSLN